MYRGGRETTERLTHLMPTYPTSPYAAEAYPHAHARSGRYVQAVDRPLVGSLILNVLIISGVVCLNLLGNIGNILSFGAISIWALTSTPNAVKAMSLGGLIIISNQALVIFGPSSAVLRMLVLLTPGLRIWMDYLLHPRPLRNRAPLITLFMFVTVCVLLALINEYYTEIAILKAVSFGFAASAMLIAGDRLSTSKRSLDLWFVSICVYLLVMSAILSILGFGMGTEGTRGAGRFFRGALNHSQSLGIVACMCVIYLLTLYQFSLFPWKKPLLGLALAQGAMIVLTEARTGLLAMALGIFTLFWYSIKSKNVFASIQLQLNRRKLLHYTGLIIMGVFLFNLFSGGQLTAELKEFLLKHTSETELSFEALTFSRIGVIEQSWLIFRQRVWTGIGFGTATTNYFVQHASLFQAPTEKAFIPTALLEETGIIGSAFFWIFFFGMIRSFANKYNYPAAIGMFTFLFVNFGEMMFFSLGGLGGFIWPMMVGFSAMTKSTD